MTTALAVHYFKTYGVGTPLQAPKASGLDQRRLKRALDFLDQGYTEDVSLDALASDVAMSKFHLARLFKGSTGLSP
jgi:AraC family transcriptional regulator